MLPLKRTENLVVTEHDGETVVFDLDSGVISIPGDLKRELEKVRIAYVETKGSIRSPFATVADEALAAYDEASNRREEDLEQWRIDFTIADWFLQEEYFDRAQEFGRRALDGAPADVAEQIQQFIDSAAAAGGQVDG